ncbi:MAG: DUF4465 domain-containing protein [Bacteroidales bacterium]|nr:DUF4465 domain-containing protein [Bacteroidales bacterium]
MKKVLFLAFLSVCAIACKLDGYTEQTMTSISDFEYDIAMFTDSLYLTSFTYGGTYSYSLYFDSARESTGKEMTGGTGLTMKRDSSIVLKENNPYPQYTMFAKTAGSESKTCAVYYQNDDPNLMPDHDIVFFNADAGTCTPSYFAINNTQQTVYDVLSEESPMKYEPGDYLKLTITGWLKNEYTGAMETTGTITYYLADWRGMKDEPDSVLTKWRTVSLTKLGDIQYIDFDLESNKDNLVKTFCYDNLISSIYLKY